MAKKIQKSSKSGSGTKVAKKPRVLQVDFTGVEAGKRGRRVPEGDYLLKIKDYAVGDADGDKDGWLRVEFDIAKGPVDGEYSELFGLGKKALWRLRLFLEAVGFKKLKSSLNKIPVEKLPGKTIGATIEDHVYNNKTKSQIAEFFTKEEFEALMEDSDEDEEDTDEDTDEEDEESDDDADLTDGDDDDDDDELEVVDDDDDDI